jgi:hypothetical protein
METLDFNGLQILSDQECEYISGGSDSLDKSIAEYLGMGVGYLAKKLWKGFQIYSANLYELQKNTQVIYK